MNNFDLPLLPPSVNFQSLLKLIIEAHEAVARYDVAFSKMHNSSFLLNISQSNEAVLSSRIEGTQATLEEVLQSDKECFDDSKKLDIEEILNYRQALKEGQELIDKKNKSLSEEMIKNLHKTLLSSGRGSQFQPGEYKKQPNWIGKIGGQPEEATYIPPPVDKIPKLMTNLFQYLNSRPEHQEIVQIAIGHYQFEAIHPFTDGNGRIGRLIIPLYLYQKKVTACPNLYISEFLEVHKNEYYQYLKDIQTHNNWIQWIQFFLVAIRNQARLLNSRADQIEGLYQEIQGILTDFNSIFTINFLETIFERPVFTPQLIRKLTDIKHIKTVYSLIDKFEKRDYIELIHRQNRLRVYRFKKLLDIIQSIK